MPLQPLQNIQEYCWLLLSHARYPQKFHFCQTRKSRCSASAHHSLLTLELLCHDLFDHPVDAAEVMCFEVCVQELRKCLLVQRTVIVTTVCLKREPALCRWCWLSTDEHCVLGSKHLTSPSRSLTASCDTLQIQLRNSFYSYVQHLL